VGAVALEVLGIQGDLLVNPERGSLLQGLGGVRKGRSSKPARGKGQRGGYRYFFISSSILRIGAGRGDLHGGTAGWMVS